MKNILLLAHDDEGQEARLQVALDVTRAVEGHLTCLDVVVPPAALTYDSYSGAVAAELMADEQLRETANCSRLEARLAHENVSWDLKEAVGFPGESVEAAAGLADLIVLSSPFGHGQPSELRRLVGQVAGRARRPILAVPKDAGGLDLSGTVLVAWDGSSEADAALRDAVPLLKLSGNVILLDVEETEGAFAATSAAKYLSRHDIHPRIEIARPDVDGMIYAALLEKAHEVEATYIVMGAFGHSPAVETLFGGVTRSMLAHSDLPLFLAH
ncbi:Nucleotide-binding universal stress protein, UspA family [Novosphingobium sp. CF614]|uniref:universal stress protein n=1 Tax=Novosphingobium sp. CF614 TaxID=1884364 RepID=UPI0008F446FB|nr:universal stress protein [Novosphingobium sp. CF614]SFF82402.1 Nucleotide-binding universal stress protein, UspA family [Novosphingobium sp. CF614]